MHMIFANFFLEKQLKKIQFDFETLEKEYNLKIRELKKISNENLVLKKKLNSKHFVNSSSTSCVNRGVNRRKHCFHYYLLLLSYDCYYSDRYLFRTRKIWVPKGSHIVQTN